MAGRITFSTENVKKNEYDFPKLKLKKNEIARIVLLEDPVAAYVHDLREPKLVNGIPEKEMKTRYDKTQYEDFVYNFVGRPICLGDAGTLEDIGSDPVNCPICAEAKSSDRASAPKRRFAMHVIKYATKTGTSEIQTPYSVQTLLWSFTDKVFAKLVGFMQEWGDIRTHDIIVKCENEIFQNYELSIAAKAAWMEDEDKANLTKATFKDNQAADLEIFCGSKRERKYIEMDLDQIRKAWSVATGAQSTPSAADAAALSGIGATVNLEAGLAGLLDSTPAPVAQTTPSGAQTEWLATPDADGDNSLAASVAAPEADSTVADFDDLLAGL